MDVREGLSAADAGRRLDRDGPNRLAEATKEPRWRAFLRQFQAGQWASGALLLSDAHTVRGFLRERRGDAAGAREAWREAYRSARLVLPLARFVEGRAWFSDASGGPLAVAGLYRLGAGPTTAPLRRATMLTRPADDLVAPFHERMPVILPADLIGPWLGGAPVPVARLLDESPALSAEPLTRPGPPPPDQLTLL